MVKKLGKIDGPSRVATTLMASGLAAAAMLAWVLWHLGVLAEMAGQSMLFVMAWLIVAVLSVCTLLAFRQTTRRVGTASTVYLLLGVGSAVLVALATVLMASPWVLPWSAGNMFDGGEYALPFATCLVLFALGAAWDPVMAKYRRRPRKVTPVLVEDSNFGRGGDDYSYSSLPPQPPVAADTITGMFDPQ